eukprot:TRINITY_DN40894_c0_g1_i1.p1 TRINITY_DN40894_c0_g1~~TRINITY_DN40894_c0_g1_i1.p1  ORF type:complete len:1200 (-),score=154.65 TRINITY_DN40894_c0_g1_i1:81-3680(-)
MTEMRERFKKVIGVCLLVSRVVNVLVARLIYCTSLFCSPQITKYQARTYFIYILQLFAHDLVLITTAKALGFLFHCRNFVLLLSVGSIPPFLKALIETIRDISCPPIATIVSNILLLCSLGALFGLGINVYSNVWVLYAYAVGIWSWLVLASVVARQYSEQAVVHTPFSPLVGLPLLGCVSAVSYLLAFFALKDLSVTEVIALSLLDPIVCGISASMLLGKVRRKFHFGHLKIYFLLAITASLYRYGEQNTTTNVPLITQGHVFFILSRFLLALRSAYVKRCYGLFNHAMSPQHPPESEVLFYNHQAPHLHRFGKFNAPKLRTLDAIFDSGLRDMDFHGMGSLGTVDLYRLAEMPYILPVATTASWIFEKDTLSEGIFSYANARTPAFIRANVTDIDGDPNEGVILAGTIQSVLNTLLSPPVLIFFFCLARLLRPFAASVSQFDRGSSMFAWKYQPVFLILPFFFVDVLFINETLSKFQIVVVITLIGIFAYHRDVMWTSFRRKYLLLTTQDMQYRQPSSCRTIQRQALLDVLERTSIEDYGMMLLATGVRHGANVRLLAKATKTKIWDPAPSGTAAWKLAFSLVLMSLKRNKKNIARRREQREEIEGWCKKLVLEIVGKSVDLAAGHGRRLKHAGALAAMFAKRRAVIRLRARAVKRRQLREQRRVGQLASAPIHLATTGGKLRAVSDLELKPPPKGFPLVPPPPQSRGRRCIKGGDDDGTRGLNSPTELSRPVSAFSGASVQSSAFGTVIGTDWTESVASGPLPRGVWSFAAAATSQVDKTGKSPPPPPGGSVVIAFGDGRRGQLGLGRDDLAKHIASGATVTVVETLRSYDPVQVVATGVSSFVVGSRGYCWAFGSNRQMELGMRKEITQVDAPQRIKSLREHDVVQLAGCGAASTQAHTLALTAQGFVYTMGSSSRGALGQGPQVQQTAPLLLRMSQESTVRLVVAGGHHSLMVTDEGRVFTFGDNTYGQLGLGPKVPSTSFPEPLEHFMRSSGKVRLLAAGDNHTVAVTTSDRVFSWGANSNGQLGVGPKQDQSEPHLVKELLNMPISSIACGSMHSAAVARQGTLLWTWGSNTKGQLGVGYDSSDGQQRSAPSLVRSLSNRAGFEILQVTAAACHTLLVTRKGEVFAFGDNTYGQLGFLPAGGNDRDLEAGRVGRGGGDGDSCLWTPKRVVGLKSWHIKAVSTAEMHSLALGM